MKVTGGKSECRRTLWVPHLDPIHGQGSHRALWGLASHDSLLLLSPELHPWLHEKSSSIRASTPPSGYPTSTIWLTWKPVSQGGINSHVLDQSEARFQHILQLLSSLILLPILSFSWEHAFNNSRVSRSLYWALLLRKKCFVSVSTLPQCHLPVRSGISPPQPSLGSGLQLSLGSVFPFSPLVHSALEVIMVSWSCCSLGPLYLLFISLTLPTSLQVVLLDSVHWNHLWWNGFQLESCLIQLASAHSSEGVLLWYITKYGSPQLFFFNYKVSLFLHFLNLGWPCDFLWPMRG